MPAPMATHPLAGPKSSAFRGRPCFPEAQEVAEGQAAAGPPCSQGRRKSLLRFLGKEMVWKWLWFWSCLVGVLQGRGLALGWPCPAWDPCLAWCSWGLCPAWGLCPVRSVWDPCPAWGLCPVWGLCPAWVPALCRVRGVCALCGVHGVCYVLSEKLHQGCPPCVANIPTHVSALGPSSGH